MNKYLENLKDTINSYRLTIKSISALATGNMAGSLLGAVGGVLVARFVAPEVNGQFRLFTIPLMYLIFLHLGTFDGIHRQIPFLIGREQPDHIEKIAAASGAWNLLVAAIVASGFLICALWEFWHGNYMNAAGWVSQAFVCVGIYYGGYLGATYRTLNNFVVLARIQLILASVAFCLVFAVALLGFYGLCLRAAIPAIIGAWLYHRARPLRMQLHFDFVALKEVVKVGLPICFWGTLYTSLWVAAEYSLMLYFAGVKGVGLFAIAVIMRESLSILPQSVLQVFMPRVFESYARNGGVHNVAKRTFGVTVALSLFMILVVLLVSLILTYFVPLFIPKYVDGLLLMQVCLGLTIIHALSLPLEGLVATGRSWLYGKGILVGLVTFPVAVYLLNPLLGGMLAVAVGSLAGRMIRTVVAYFDLFILMRREVC
jgi:O-antigen/teichoic acid export membrane protein